MSEIVRAGLLIIGDEILSGRTQDANTTYLATWLNDVGIQLCEVRIVADEPAAIVEAANIMRARYDYLFTTGGIGPTHDDITMDSLAKAFDVPLIVHPEAYRLLEDYYGADKFTPERQRMARAPEGAVLVENKSTVAPGMQMDNVFILAGVPFIMQAMLEGLRSRLKGGSKVYSQTVTVKTIESKLVQTLESIQAAYEDVSLGSYPFRKGEDFGVQIVASGRDLTRIEHACDALTVQCDQLGMEVVDEEEANLTFS